MPPELEPHAKTATVPDVLTKEGYSDWLNDVRKALKKMAMVQSLSVERAVDDYVTSPNQGDGAALTLPLTTAAPWTLTSVLCCIPTTVTSAVLQLKDRLIPVQMTPFVLSPLQFQMDPHDLIQLTIHGASGLVFLAAAGFENGPLK